MHRTWQRHRTRWAQGETSNKIISSHSPLREIRICSDARYPYRYRVSTRIGPVHAVRATGLRATRYSVRLRVLCVRAGKLVSSLPHRAGLV